MSIRNIAKVVYEAESGVIKPELLSWLQGQPCEGSKFHSPSPLLVRAHYLSDEVDLVVPKMTELIQEDLVFLCSTCADNLTVYLSIRWAYDGAMPLMVRRDFGNIIRDLGDRAWEHHIKRSTRYFLSGSPSPLRRDEDHDEEQR